MSTSIEKLAAKAAWLWRDEDGFDEQDLTQLRRDSAGILSSDELDRFLATIENDGKIDFKEYSRLCDSECSNLQIFSKLFLGQAPRSRGDGLDNVFELEKRYGVTVIGAVKADQVRQVLKVVKALPPGLVKGGFTVIFPDKHEFKQIKDCINEVDDSEEDYICDSGAVVLNFGASGMTMTLKIPHYFSIPEKRKIYLRGWQKVDEGGLAHEITHLRIGKDAAEIQKAPRWSALLRKHRFDEKSFTEFKIDNKGAVSPNREDEERVRDRINVIYFWDGGGRVSFYLSRMDEKRRRDLVSKIESSEYNRYLSRPRFEGQTDINVFSIPLGALVAARRDLARIFNVVPQDFDRMVKSFRDFTSTHTLRSAGKLGLSWYETVELSKGETESIVEQKLKLLRRHGYISSLQFEKALMKVRQSSPQGVRAFASPYGELEAELGNLTEDICEMMRRVYEDQDGI